MSVLRTVRIANLYGSVQAIKLLRDGIEIGIARYCSPAPGRGVVWMMDALGLEAELEFAVVVSPCRNESRLAITIEAMLTAVEARLGLLASTALEQREVA